MKKTISRTKIVAFFLAIITLLETMPLAILAGKLAPSVKITFNGEEVSEVTLIEDDRITLSAETDFTGDTISYQWEIYANKDEGMWVKIGDKKSKDCVVTYALVSSLLDDNGCAKLRVSATSGSDTAVSDPVTVKVSYLVNNSIKNNSAAAASEPVVMKSARHASLASLNSESVLIGDNVKAEADGAATTYLITLKYHFVDVNGNFVANVLSDDRTLSVTKDSPQYDAVLPVQIGYTPVLVPTDFDCQINQIDGEYILHLNFSNISSNIEITINYTPNHNITYTVYHHVQNPDDDRYTIHSTEVFHDGIVGEPVPEGLQYSKDELDGYDYLYYIREMVTPDGQTSIHIYYDCKYYLVSFDLDVNGQGQDPIYVRYGSEIYLNTPVRIGFGFKGYELRRYGNTEYDWTYSISSNDEVEIHPANSDTSIMAKYSINQLQVANGENRKPIIVTTDLHYEVIWSSTETEFTILYWKENANDGNYSLWGKQTVKTYKDGTHVYSGDVVNALTYSALPDDLNTDEAKEFFVYNEAKTASGGDVVVQGNGTTTVSVYYLRRRYTLDFTIDTTIPSGTTEANCPYRHTHGKDCIMGTSDCTHVHTDECVTNGTCSKAHVHDNSCTLQCSDPVHIHSSDCCIVHVHEPVCYGAASNTPVTNFNGINIPTRAKQGEIYANVINDSWFRYEADYYVFIGNNWYILNTESSSALESFLSGSGCAGDVQKGTMSTGQIASSEYCSINKHSSHDHTFGCCYSSCGKEHTHTQAACGLNCVDTTNHNNFDKHTDACFTCGKLAHSHESTAKCNTTEHVHTSECYSCKTEEHVCDAYCNCTHVHNEDCYTPCILTHDCKDHATSAQTNPVVFKITAKYEQDISELWPDFEVMQKLGWSTKDNQNFYAWNFQIGEGDSAPKVTQYYKYPNMIADICFTYNMNIKALYSASTKPYVVYFMFEDLDQQSTSVKPFSSNGTARQQYNGKWYTSSSEHFQGFFMTGAPEQKSILGMNYLYTDTTQPDMKLNGLDCDVYVFYYDRNTAGINIQLYNSDTTTPIVVYAPTATTVSGVSATIDTDVKFGMPVSEIIPEDLFTGKALTVPEQYRYGYEFGGWYASEYPADSTKVYSYTTVPNQVLMLFAYWKPIEYTVRIWNSDPSADESATLNTTITVPYGHNINFSLENFTYDRYSEVIGCFYHDDTDGDGIADTEKRFLFNNIPVKGNMDLYAKWSSRETIKYVLKYVYVDPDTGNEIQIARDEEGYTLSGQSKTFTAKTNDQLFGPYQKNYYPTIRTATVNLMSDNDPETEDVVSHTFYYEFDDTMEYYVHYLPAAGSTEEEITKFNAALAEAAKENPDLADGVIVCKDEDTHFAIVTEDFISLLKFLPDAYSKSLVLTATKNEDEAYPYVNNHIYFYYTYNETEAYYKIVHQTQNLENMSSYTEFSSSQIVGLIGADTAPEKAKDNIVGFHFAKAEAWTVDKDGNTVVTTLSPDGGNYKSTISANGTTIYFFYDRNSYDYSVKYTDKATEELELSPTVNGTALYQSTVIAPYVDLEAKAWQIVGEAADRKIVIEAESQGDLRNNTTVFMYTELTAVINYVLVGSEEGGKLNITNQDVVGAATGRGVLGSEAVLLDSENYRFVGWFEDEACTVPVTDNNPAYTLESTNGLNFNKITPKKYDTGHTDSNGQSILLYQNATYYAKFEPNNATLTITVNADRGNNNQRVLLHIVGKADTNAEKVDLIISVPLGQNIVINDIPVGEYTISEVAGDWTWRYGESGVQNVTVPVGGGQATFTLTLSNDRWFDSDSYGTYNNVTSYGGQ